MIITSINYPGETEYYTKEISIMYGSNQTKGYLVGISDISRSAGQGRGFENSNCDVTYNDVNGYFSQKLIGDDQYIKGRKHEVFDYDQVTGVATLLFSGYISDMGDIQNGQFNLRSDIITANLDAEICQTSITVSEFPNLYDTTWEGLKKNIIYGSRAGQSFKNVGSYPSDFNLVAYKTDTGVFLAARHALKALKQCYAMISGMMTSISLIHCTLDNNADGNAYILYSVNPTDDGKIYFSADGAMDGSSNIINNPALVIQDMVAKYLPGMSFDSTEITAAAAILNTRGYDDQSGTFTGNDFIFSDSTTWRDFLNRFMEVFDCVIYLRIDGKLGIKVNNWLSKTSLGVITTTAADNLKYKKDMTTVINNVAREYQYTRCENYFHYLPQDNPVVSGWPGIIKYLDQREIRNPVLSWDSSSRYITSWCRPRLWYSFTVPASYSVNATKAIALDIGNIITLNHAKNMMYPSQDRYVFVTGVTISDDATAVEIVGFDANIIHDPSEIIRLYPTTSSLKYLLCAHGDPGVKTLVEV